MQSEQRRCALVALLIVVAAVWALAAQASADTGEQSSNAAHEDIHVRDDGTYMLVRYTTDGTRLQRYTGFRNISDIAVYDDTTVLVAEPDQDTISAMTLEGRIIWTIAVHRPRCLQVLGPDRFLVCLDDPAGVAEIDRTGTVHWKVTSPLIDAAGAVRLPDGNTAVVEGRAGHHAVHVLSPEGKILWTGTKLLAQPRGLARLPTGELVTSGFDSGQIVLFQPYTDAVRSFGFCCHALAPSVTPGGEILGVTGEQQQVRAWKPSGATLWDFRTFYPPNKAEMLSDGTLLVSVFRVPDRQCLNAAAAAQRADRPLAPYWRWLAIGVGTALLLGLVVQWPVVRRSWPVWNGTGAAGWSHPKTPGLSRWRRMEIAGYVVAAVALGTAAVLYHQRILWSNRVGLLPHYAVLIGLAGVFVAVLQYRLPVAPDDWTLRMTRLAPTLAPTWRMWVLWIVGCGLLAVSMQEVLHRTGAWVPATWSAGLVLLLAGALQERTARPRLRSRSVVIGLLFVSALLFLRLYRLEEYPPNLHLDMAQWSVQTFRLLDGDVGTLFTNGWAEIPMLGYVWPALWTAVGGRSLAGCRLASVVGSTLTLGLMFVLVRRLYGTFAGLVAVIVLGTNHGFLHFSRTQAYMAPIPFHVLGVLGLVAGLESGAYGWFAVAGLAGGYSALSYHSGRITPPIMLLLGIVLLLRYPRAIVRRWPGLLLCAVALLAILGPQMILYHTTRINPYGRMEVYRFLPGGHLDFELLQRTVQRGVPAVIGAFWLYGDTSTQFGSGWPIFFPPWAALLGMAVVPAVLRPRDIRGILLLLWGCVILFVGGALTIDPPFWPRFVIAFIPATMVAAGVAAWLYRGARVAAGRVGGVLAIGAMCGLLSITTWQQLKAYRDYCLGIRPTQSWTSVATQWTQGIMGRDIQRWGSSAMMYIVASNPMWHSCTHPTMRYYADTVDLQDARDIAEYLPFKDPRTIVCYVLPEMTKYIATVRRVYPDLEETPFYNNLGQQVFTRLVIRAPHA